MKFVADDGKIFDTMEECEEYEQIHSVGKEIAQLWYNNITTYDNEGRVTEPDTDVNDTSNYLKEVYDIMSDCYKSTFIQIGCSHSEWMKIRKYFEEEYGINLPIEYLPIECGTWRYDNDNYEWINFEKELKTFKENWAPLGIC